MSDHTTVAVIGAGSWGTGLAWLLGNKGLDTWLWCRRPEQAEAIADLRQNPVYLTGIDLPVTVRSTSDLDEALSAAHLAIVAMPSTAVASYAPQVGAALRHDAMLLSAVKGLDQATGHRMTTILSAACLGHQPVAALSGPNLAHEIAAGQPAVAVVAHASEEVCVRVQTCLLSDRFRVYTSSDVAGVELGGALKNPLAIAAGISDGLGYGDNTKAALMTRGIHEMTRLGSALGADPRTFAGLCGFGDLLATCHSPHSRNRNLGERIGRGEALAAIIASTSEVVEGVATTATALRLARSLDVEMPILEQLHAVLFEGLSPCKAVHHLLTRAIATEY